MKTALLASYEKDAHLLRLGKLLTKSGWKLLGSAGTAKYLNENGIPCRDVAETVGKPLLGHKVVTLSREIHASILGTPADSAELKELGLEPYDLVYVTLYPLEKTVADNSATPADVIEKTDIGGPTLLRAAAKARKIVLSSPEQLGEFEARLRSETTEDEKYRMSLAAAAERRVADYVAASADYWEKKVK